PFALSCKHKIALFCAFAHRICSYFEDFNMKLSPDQPLAGILEPVFAIRPEDDLGKVRIKKYEFPDRVAAFGRKPGTLLRHGCGGQDAALCRAPLRLLRRRWDTLQRRSAPVPG